MKNNIPILPLEIVEEIWILKDVHEKKILFDKIKIKIPLASIFAKINRIEKIYKERLNTTYDSYEDVILNNTCKIERENMVDILNTCNCCERHRTNRPTIDEYKNGFVPDYPFQTSRHHINCLCLCRSMCRSICRAENDEVFE